MDYTYIKSNTNKKPQDREDFMNQFEKMCNAFDVIFTQDDKYRPVSDVLLDVFASMLKFRLEY